VLGHDVGLDSHAFSCAQCVRYVALCGAATEREGNTMKGLEDFHPNNGSSHDHNPAPTVFYVPCLKDLMNWDEERSRLEYRGISLIRIPLPSRITVGP